jgi:hypothetical protein
MIQVATKLALFEGKSLLSKKKSTISPTNIIPYTMFEYWNFIDKSILYL